MWVTGIQKNRRILIILNELKDGAIKTSRSGQILLIHMALIILLWSYQIPFCIIRHEVQDYKVFSKLPYEEVCHCSNEVS